MQKRVTCRGRILAICISIVILFSLSLTLAPFSTVLESSPPSDKLYSPSLTPHAPISISSDNDFKDLGFEGNGSKVSPYLIKDLLINNGWFDNPCISIVSTSVFFVIENCELTSWDDKTGTGIYLEKVTNGVVNNSYIHFLAAGISVQKSETGKFENNRFSRLGTGIYITQSTWISVKGNDIKKSDYGIHLSKTDYTDIANNVIDDSDYGILIINSVEAITYSNDVMSAIFGIYFHNGLRCTSESNLVQYSQYGVYIAYSQDCNVTSSELIKNKSGISLYEVNTGTLQSNNVRLNSDYGIHLKDSQDISILNNTVFKNSGVGLYLIGVTGASVHYNEIGFSSGSNAIDFVGGPIKGLVNNWDTNAWSDYTGTSTYKISGDRGSSDNDPRYILYLSSPVDLILEAPASGVIDWSASAFRPCCFSISLNSDILQEDTWDGRNVSTPFFDLDPGTYTYSVSVSTLSGISTTDEVIVNIHDTTSPEWVETPEDQIIESGSSLSYQLFATDYYGINRWWVNSSDFIINDGLMENTIPLSLDVYHIEVRAYDPSDNYVSHVLTISVVDTTIPSVDSPEDIVFQEGEIGFSIVWNVYDLNPLSYEILKDGISVEVGIWSLEMTQIEYSLDDLSSGTYTFTIVLLDSAGNTVSDHVEVTVEGFTTTETTTETITTSTTT
ncbi:MAG: nitrous oxide reductase family maturation protein NosD, partial [Candidatus Thorarchaeota archaeon]